MRRKEEGIPQCFFSEKKFIETNENIIHKPHCVISLLHICCNFAESDWGHESEGENGSWRSFQRI